LTCPRFDFIILNEGTVKISEKLNIECDVTMLKKMDGSGDDFDRRRHGN